MPLIHYAPVKIKKKLNASTKNVQKRKKSGPALKLNTYFHFFYEFSAPILCREYA